MANKERSVKVVDIGGLRRRAKFPLSIKNLLYEKFRFRYNYEKGLWICDDDD